MLNNVLLYETTEFWICVSFITYFSGNFFYVLLVETSKAASFSTKNQLTIIYCAVTIIKNCFFTYSILGTRRVKTDASTPQIEEPTNFNTLTANNT